MIGFNFYKYSTTTNKSKGCSKPDVYDFLKYDVFLSDVVKITSSKAFRRLQGKASVVDNYEVKNNHYRNRMTHSIEVANMAKIIAKRMNACIDLAEAISLAHDIGHPPFGHMGETILRGILKNFNASFCHNNHGLRIVSGAYSGDDLNLSFECIDGFLKHNFPVKAAEVDECNDIFKNKGFEFSGAKYPSIEAQISAISDDIAYLTHDIEDAIRFGMDKELFLQIDIIKNIREKHKLEDFSEIKNHLRDLFINDVIFETYSRVNSNAKEVYVDFSKDIKSQARKLRELMMDNFYCNYNEIIQNKYKSKMLFVFEELLKNCSKIKNDNIKNLVIQSNNEREKAILVCDYIAGMTDTYVVDFANELKKIII